MLEDAEDEGRVFLLDEDLQGLSSLCDREIDNVEEEQDRDAKELEDLPCTPVAIKPGQSAPITIAHGKLFQPQTKPTPITDRDEALEFLTNMDLT